MIFPNFFRNSKAQDSQERIDALTVSFNVEGRVSDFQIKKIDLAQAEKSNRNYILLFSFLKKN